eukprot:tig00000157_g9667.t1
MESDAVTVRLEGDLYRLYEVFSLPWSAQELEESIVAVAPFGGPLALTRDYRKLVLLHGPTDREIRTYTAAGDPLAAFEAPKGRALALGWTRDLQLAVVADDGATYLYTMLGQLLRTVPFRSKPSGPIVDACCWADGCAVFAREAAGIRPHAIVDLSAGPRTVPLAPLAPAGPPALDWGVTAAACRRGPSGAPEAIVVLRDGSGRVAVCRSTPDAASDVTGSLAGGEAPSALAGLALSPSGGSSPFSSPCAARPPRPPRRLCQRAGERGGAQEARASASAPAWRLRVARSDSLQVVTDVALPPAAGARPSVQWVGSDAVAVAGEGELLLAAASGALARLELGAGPPAALGPEPDGSALVTPDARLFLSRLPPAAAEAAAPGSTAPGALLLDASDSAEEEPGADHVLRRLRSAGDLPRAIDSLLEAALHEPSPAAQKRLLQAASLGDSYNRSASSPLVAQACSVLRLMNALRAEGIPITYPQLQAAGAAGVIGHLMARRQHLLAARLCAHAGLPSEGVLLDWAAARLAGEPSAPDAALLSALVEKAPAPPPPGLFAELAGAAVAHGRPRLAALLLEREPLAERGAPPSSTSRTTTPPCSTRPPRTTSAWRGRCCGCSGGDRRRSCSRCSPGRTPWRGAGGRSSPPSPPAPATASSSRPSPSTPATGPPPARPRPRPRSLTGWGREEAGLGTLAEFLASPAAAEAAERAAVAQRSGDFFAGDPFLTRVLAAESARLRAQPPPPRGAPAPPVRTSPAEGLAEMLEEGDERGYKRLAAAMGLSPARSARLRARAACRRRDWPALEALAKEGKARTPASAPPRWAGGGADRAGPGAQVPLEALVEAAAAGGAVQEAARLAARLPDRDAKIFYFLQLNCLREAAEAAAAARDPVALQAVRARATDPNLLLLIDRALQAA